MRESHWCRLDALNRRTQGGSCNTWTNMDKSRISISLYDFIWFHIHNMISRLQDLLVRALTSHSFKVAKLLKKSSWKLFASNFLTFFLSKNNRVSWVDLQKKLSVQVIQVIQVIQVARFASLWTRCFSRSPSPCCSHTSHRRWPHGGHGPIPPSLGPSGSPHGQTWNNFNARDVSVKSLRCLWKIFRLCFNLCEEFFSKRGLACCFLPKTQDLRIPGSAKTETNKSKGQRRSGNRQVFISFSAMARMGTPNTRFGNGKQRNPETVRLVFLWSHSLDKNQSDGLIMIVSCFAPSVIGSFCKCLRCFVDFWWNRDVVDWIKAKQKNVFFFFSPKSSTTCASHGGSNNLQEDTTGKQKHHEHQT